MGIHLAVHLRAVVYQLELADQLHPPEYYHDNYRGAVRAGERLGPGAVMRIHV